MNPLWSWALAVIGMTGMWLAGRKRWYAWLVNLGSQTVWLSYGVATRQWGFVASAFGFGTVYVINHRRWRREERTRRAAGDTQRIG